ncbi:MAG: hypothetical protein ACT4P7_23460 [Gemmatimonadaceae bacterium]
MTELVLAATSAAHVPLVIVDQGNRPPVADGNVFLQARADDLLPRVSRSPI